MKNIFKLSTLFLCLFVASCSNDDDAEKTPINNNLLTTADVYNPITNETVGSSTLVRTENSITANYQSSGLTPGYAYTLWILVINQPANCAGSPCAFSDVVNPDVNIMPEVMFIDGHVINETGIGIFTGGLNENDNSSSINSIMGLPEVGGMLDAKTVEIHLILRSHGPANPDEIIAQTTTFSGGCTTNFPMFSEIPDAMGECGQIQASIHIAN